MLRHLPWALLAAVATALVFLHVAQLEWRGLKSGAALLWMFGVGCLPALAVSLYGFIASGVLAGLMFPIVAFVGGAFVATLLESLLPRVFPPAPARPAAGGAPGAPAAPVSRPRGEPIGVAPPPDLWRVGTWLSSRGNCRNTAWTPAHGPHAPELAWRYRLPSASPEFGRHLHGAAVVDAHGTVYLATERGLAALGPDGTQRWIIETGHAAAAPALDPSGNVVSATRRGLLIVRPDGTRTWREAPGTPNGAVNVAPDGTIVVAGSATAGSGEPTVRCFAPDGTSRWSAASLLRSVPYPPAIGPAGQVLVRSDDCISWNEEDPSARYDQLCELSAGGAELRREDESDEGPYSTWGACAAMCLEDGTAITGIGEAILVGDVRISVRGGGAMALDPRGQLLVAGEGGLRALNVRGGEIWRAPVFAGSPIVDGEGRIYGCGDKTIQALSSEGTPLWTWKVPSDSPSIWWLQGLAIGPNGFLIVATYDELFALADP